MPLTKKIMEFIDYHLDSNNEDSINTIIDYFVNCTIEEKENLIDYLLEVHQADWIIDSLDNLAEQDESGNTLLHYAISNNHAAVVNLILKSDNIDKASENGDLALTEIGNKRSETPLNIVTPLNNILIDIDQYQLEFDTQRKTRSQLLYKQTQIRQLETTFAPTYWKQKLESSSSTTQTIIPKQQTGRIPQWKDAACLPQYNWLSKSTGQLVWKDLSASSTLNQNVSGVRWGSGCLIANNLFLTAGHCFDPLSKKSWKLSDVFTDEPLKSMDFIPLMTVNFSYQLATCSVSSNKNSSILHEKKFNIRRLVEHKMGGYDYAILELEDLPGQELGTVQLSIDLPHEKEEVVIAQHPNGEVKKIHYGPARCKTALCGVDDGRIYYEVDTDPGSSGSPVALTNKKIVIGVHTTGFDETDIQVNSAVSIRAIKQVSNVLNNSRFGFFQGSTNNKNQLNEEREYYYRNDCLH